MTTIRLTTVLAVCALAACLHQSPARAGAVAAACELDNVERIVAVGDVHGAYDQMIGILRAAEVINAEGRWSGGATHLVQTGDVLDRGPDSLKAMEYLRRLTREAERAGGRVHALLGNHEVMRVLENYAYVHPGEYDAFKNAGSQDLRQRIADQASGGQREKILATTPLGMIEMLQAYKPEGTHGAYLRTLNTSVRINGIVFVHGGISPSVAKMNCEALNEAVRREIGRDYDKTRRAPLQSLSGGENGPLWYRGLALEPDEFAPEVDAILAAQKARAIVVGHSVASKIGSRFNGKVYLIDTGMQLAYRPDGQASALEIKGSVITAIYPDRKEVLAGR